MTESGIHELRWVEESKLLEILGLPRSTFQGWVKAGLVEADPGGAYDEARAMELALLALLRGHFSVQDLTTLWRHLRSARRVAGFVERARALTPGARYDLVVSPIHGAISIAMDDGELAAAIRHPGAPRSFVVLDAAPALLLVRESFATWAHVGRRPTQRKVGRPARRPVDASELG